ncbi:MAG: aldo/keto reductase [Candidatus Micrarchaeaceae archaeon]
MEKKNFDGADIKVSELGIGTWQLTGSEQENIAALKYALDNGVNFIDTAEIYGTESIVGKAIKAKNRKELFIATKLWTSNFRYDDAIKACYASLERLGTSYVDLYQLHWPNKDVPIAETMKAMEKLADEGKIRSIGVSNFSVEELKEAQEAMPKYKIASNQVEYSIVTRDIESEGLIDYCKKEGIEIIAYSPLAHGKIFEDKELVGLLEGIGKKYNKTPAQVAINWLIKKEVFPIPKASNIMHVKENIAATEFSLSNEDMKSIEEAYAKHRKDPLAKTIKR